MIRFVGARNTLYHAPERLVLRYWIDIDQTVATGPGEGSSSDLLLVCFRF